MNILLRKIPEYLFDKLIVLRQITFTAIFALIFINIYAPFNAENWFEAGKAELFVYSSLYILAGILVIAFSRLLFINIALKIQINYLLYGIWILFEIILLAIAYTLMDYFILLNETKPFEHFIELLFATMFVLAIPYSISWLYYSYREQMRKLKELSTETSKAYSSGNMITFYDETDKLRFSLNSSDVLYIESTDNYVTVYVEDGERIKKIMLRNTMKKLEIELEKTLIRRCHRSFMVNFENVKMVRLSGTSLFVFLETISEVKIPVSRTYTEKVHEIINKLSM
jgi:DNA-binding LytR/AlgR family response regulator